MKRGLAASRKRQRKNVTPYQSDGYVEERSALGPVNLTVPGGSSAGSLALPLRLLDGFCLYTEDASGTEEVVGLERLENGSVDGRALRGRGVLLDHRAAASAIGEARELARVRVQIRYIRDWVVDYSEPGAVWLISDWAWYRLIAPAEDYMRAFAPALKMAQLAWRCAGVMFSAPLISFHKAVPRILAADFGSNDWNSDEEDGFDPYWGVVDEGEFSEAYIRQKAGFLLRQLTPMMGRHAPKCGFLEQLSSIAGTPLAELMQPGRRLRKQPTHAPPADPELRPAPRKDFLAPPELIPALLMAWDFCSSYRGLLRLPPFPLARLEMAFTEEPPPHFKAPQEHSTPDVAASGAEAGGAAKQNLEKLQANGDASSMDAMRPATPSASSLASTRASEPAWGADGQGTLMKDIHCTMLRLMEGIDQEVQEAPTLAGYGSAADLSPHEAYRPLLPLTWPELVRHYLESNQASPPFVEAREALDALKQDDYSSLCGVHRLKLLEALIHAVADTEIVRNYMADTSTEAENAPVKKGQPLGPDSNGNLYFRLGSDSGGTQLFVEESEGAGWGFYDVTQLPGLMAWLESGSDAEQELAERIHETFKAHLQPDDDGPQAAALPSTDPANLGKQEDGYRAARFCADGVPLLREQLLALLQGARFWDKSCDWMQARAAVLAALRKAERMSELARLMWLVEDLIYDDLLKGTGWGRRRGWYREQLESCRTIAQVAVIACQLVVHCRLQADMGILQKAEFDTIVQKKAMQLPFLPGTGNEAVLLKTGYEAHKARQRPPAQAMPAEVPKSWAWAEKCRVEEVAYARGHWQRPVWQGRFAGTVPAGSDDDSLVITWLLLERRPVQSPRSLDLEEDAKGDINWEGFTFQHGFRILRPRYEAVQISPVPGADGPAPTAGAKSEAGGTPVKQEEATLQPFPKPEGTSEGPGTKPEPMDAEGPGIQGGSDGTAVSGEQRTGRSRRSTRKVTDFALMHEGNTQELSAKEEAEEAARLQAAADADDEARAGDAGEEGETRRFWVRSADFAAVAVYVRLLVGERPPHHLLPVQQFLETAGRVYTAGTPVKMPCYGITIAEAVARKQAIKWFTGLLARPYLPWSFDHSPSIASGLAPASAGLGGSAVMQPFLPLQSCRPGSAPTPGQAYPGLQTPSLAGGSASSASQALTSQPPALASTAQQASGISGPTGDPVSQAQPMQFPVSVSVAQQTDHPMPQAASSQPQSELASAAPSSGASEAPAASPAAGRAPQPAAPSPASASAPGSSAAPEAQLVAGARPSSSLGGPDANGASESQAQPLSGTHPIAHSSPCPTANREALVNPAQGAIQNTVPMPQEAESKAEQHALSNGNVSAQAPPGAATMDQLASDRLQNQSDASKAAPAQQDAGAVSSMPRVYAPAAHLQGLQQDNGHVHGSLEPSVPSIAASPASAAPGHFPAGQPSVPGYLLTPAAAQPDLAGQPGQAAGTPVPHLIGARLEQLPGSAPMVQRPGSLTKVSPVTSMASAVTQQWLGSSPASAVRPAPQQGEPQRPGWSTLMPGPRPDSVSGSRMPAPVLAQSPGLPGGANPSAWPMQALPGINISQGGPLQRPLSGGQVRPPGQGNALQGTPIDGSWLCRMDPWKALDVSWDAADTPMNVPTRVSPWEVLEDVGHTLRKQKAMMRQQEFYQRQQQLQRQQQAQAEANRMRMQAFQQQQLEAAHRAGLMAAASGLGAARPGAHTAAQTAPPPGVLAVANGPRGTTPHLVLQTPGLQPPYVQLRPLGMQQQQQPPHPYRPGTYSQPGTLASPGPPGTSPPGSAPQPAASLAACAPSGAAAPRLVGPASQAGLAGTPSPEGGPAGPGSQFPGAKGVQVASGSQVVAAAVTLPEGAQEPATAAAQHAQR